MNAIVIRNKIGLQDYVTTWHAMQSFTDQRDENTADEIWILEHAPVFTQGLNGKAEHLLNPQDIPVVKTDRGGQVTYHGPGQLMVYVLLNLRRNNLGVRPLVSLLEKSVIELLASLNIPANSRCDAPGVYVANAKICSLGLRIRKGCSYHGLALNVSMDLEPFSRINPCGFKNLTMTQISAFDPNSTISSVTPHLLEILQKNLSQPPSPNQCRVD